MHLSSEPDVIVQEVDQHTEFLILASDGIWKVSFFFFYKKNTLFSRCTLFRKKKFLWEIMIGFHWKSWCVMY